MRKQPAVDVQLLGPTALFTLCGPIGPAAVRRLRQMLVALPSSVDAVVVDIEHASCARPRTAFVCGRLLHDYTFARGIHLVTGEQGIRSPRQARGVPAVPAPEPSREAPQATGLTLRRKMKARAMEGRAAGILAAQRARHPCTGGR